MTSFDNGNRNAVRHHVEERRIHSRKIQSDFPAGLASPDHLLVEFPEGPDRMPLPVLVDAERKEVAGFSKPISRSRETNRPVPRDAPMHVHPMPLAPMPA